MSGDHYRPRGGGGGRGAQNQYNDYGRGYNNHGYSHGYNSDPRRAHPLPARPPPRYGDRPPPRYDESIPPPPPPHMDRYVPHPHQYAQAPQQYPPEPPRPHRNGEYTFRGAAGGQSYRPQDTFHFQAPGPGTPSFPAEQPLPYNSRQPRRKDNGAKNSRYNPRDGGFKPKPYVPKAAHTRAILHTNDRENTPEQLAGMNGETRFKVVEESSSDHEGSVIDLVSDDDKPRKRTRTEAAAPDSAPKWSNPDPYTVLPPPEKVVAPKKDIVQAIRKAKVEDANKPTAAGAVKENVDFISFDDEMAESESLESVEELQNLASTSFMPVNGYAHGGPSTSFTPVNGYTYGAVNDIGAPPPPPPGVMPSFQDVAASTAIQYKGNKRKRAGERPSGAIIEEWQPIAGQNPTPWCSRDYSKLADQATRLHVEINDFYKFVQPHAYEEEMRKALIGRVQNAVRSFQNGRTVEIHCFGSFAAGLYLPTADMDLVAISQSFQQSNIPSFCTKGTQLFALARHLEHRGVAAPGTTTAVPKAKVPIVKFVDKITGIKVDISFENWTGITAVHTFKKWKEDYPAMPVLVVVLKQLLAMRDLNEVFNGGIGGFTTICLVVSMMQHHPVLQARAMDGEIDYGNLLMQFLELYGSKFDIRNTGIKMNPAGYFNKNDPSQQLPRQNSQRLTIEDPNLVGNDISGGSAQIETVLDCFRRAHGDMKRVLGDLHSGDRAHHSILGYALGGNYGSFIKQRQTLSEMFYGSSRAPELMLAPVNPQEQPQGNKKTKKQKKQQQSAAPAAQPRNQGLPPKPVLTDLSKNGRLEHRRAKKAYKSAENKARKKANRVHGTSERVLRSTD